METGNSTSCVVLLIEDEPLIALDIETLLAGFGCSVLGPINEVSDAQRIAQHGVFDIALVDIKLRFDDDALAVASILIKRKIPFAYVTGNKQFLSQQDDAPEAPVLVKPFSEQSLRKLVEELSCAVIGR